MKIKRLKDFLAIAKRGKFTLIGEMEEQGRLVAFGCKQDRDAVLSEATGKPFQKEEVHFFDIKAVEKLIKVSGKDAESAVFLVQSLSILSSSIKSTKSSFLTECKTENYVRFSFDLPEEIAEAVKTKLVQTVSDDVTRLQLTSLCADVEKRDAVKLVSTNGRSMSIVEIVQSKRLFSEPTEIHKPKRMFSSLAFMASSKKANSFMVESFIEQYPMQDVDSQFSRVTWQEADGTSYSIFSTHQGTYPNYERVIPEDLGEDVIALPYDDFQSIVKNANKSKDERKNDIAEFYPSKDTTLLVVESRASNEEVYRKIFENNIHTNVVNTERVRLNTRYLKVHTPLVKGNMAFIRVNQMRPTVSKNHYKDTYVTNLLMPMSFYD